jgi:pimeloyl-ACP methyl ester carboxylesterase
MLTSLLGGRVMAERYGTGTPDIVALHGWLHESSDWDDILRSENALALDLPGHGNTPVPESVWGSPEYAKLVVDAVAGVTTEPFILAAHSFGGRIAVHIAANHPELVAGLVMTGVPLFQRRAAQPPLAYRLVKGLARAGVVPDSLLQRARDRYGAPDYRASRGVMKPIFVKLVNENYDEQLARIDAVGTPVYLIWGADDAAVPVSVAVQARDAVRASELRVVAGAGHQMDDAIAKEMMAAIQDCKARAGMS